MKKTKERNPQTIAAIELAEEMCEEFGRTDMIQLPIKMGVSMYEDKDDIDLDAKIEFNKDKKEFEITLGGRSKSVGRKRFSIMHELAHFLLHEDDVRTAGCAVHREGLLSLDPIKEREADDLAAELIMPPKACEYHLSVHAPNGIITESIVLDFAEKFRVSKMAAIVRIRNLNYHVPYL